MVEYVKTLQEFEEKIESEALTVIDFTATWCGALAPKFEELAKAYEGTVTFLKIDVDENDKAAQKAEIKAMPTIKFYKSGKLLDTVVGINIKKVQDLLEAHK